MAQTSKYIRLKAVISVLFKYGIDEVLNRTNLTNHLPAFLKPNEARLEDIQNTPWTMRIRLALQELGPAYVKLGQIMSTRPDIIPVELIEELELLQDQVLANDLPIAEILKTEYDPALFDRITELSTTPLASASISQVYTGILDGAKPVMHTLRCPSPLMS